MAGLSFGAIKGMGKLIAQVEGIVKLDKVQSLHAGAEQILPYMQSVTPVDTGELRDSEEIVDGQDDVQLVASADHASYVEFGTYKMSAQPYMRPAIEAKQGDALRAIARDVEGQIRRIISG